MRPSFRGLVQVKFVLAPYLEHQTEMTELMRSTLVDWLVEVQETFELNHETLYLAVKLVDDCLSKLELVPRRQLQLLAAAAMFIAAKFDVSVRVKCVKRFSCRFCDAGIDGICDRPR